MNQSESKVFSGDKEYQYGVDRGQMKAKKRRQKQEHDKNRRRMKQMRPEDFLDIDEDEFD